MKKVCTYVPVLLAVPDSCDNINALSEIITPFVCVANKPLVCYPIDFLLNNEFEEVGIVVSVSWEKALKALVEERVASRMKVQYLSVPDGTTSMKCLSEVCSLEEFIKDRDLLVLSYDLICDVPFNHLDKLHRSSDSSLTLLLSSKPPLLDTPLPKKYKKQEREVVVFSGDELVHMAAEACIDAKLTLKPSLLKNVCNYEVHSGLVDCHLYLFSNRCVPFIRQSTMTSVQKDLVPWLVNNAYDESVRQSVAGARKLKSCIKDLQHKDNVSMLVRKLVVKAHVHKQAVCMRVRDVASFCTANFLLAKQPGAKRPPVKGLTACVESSVGEGVEVVAGRAVLKASVVGSHCSIGSNCRINNSILMSHAIIQQNVTLDNCIVCDSSRVSEGSSLKECLVFPGQAVATGNYSNKEILTHAHDRLVSA